MIVRRTFLSACLQVAAAACIGRAARSCDRQPRWLRIEGNLARATAFLASKQGADGAWRSEVYGPLKDGPSLTAFIAASLGPQIEQPAVRPTLDRAADYLALLVRGNGTIDAGPGGITYPVYAAAGAVVALGRQTADHHRRAREGWLLYLREQQLAARLGWRQEDASFGGWSFAHEPPTPLDGQPRSPLSVPNLSATVFALDALRAAGCPASDPAVQDALTFVRRCQNWSDDKRSRDSRFDDGGFFFLHNDPTRNKPGEAGVDVSGHVRYVSYGSTTADGLRALMLCGVSSDDDRARAAERWLNDHFSAERHPGNYPADREYLRQSLYYYYSASAAEAQWASATMKRSAGCDCGSFAVELAESLLSRQRDDGSWRNPAVDVREDDPLVATPLAIRALSACKGVLREIS